MAIEKISAKLGGMPPAWMSRIGGSGASAGSTTEIRKALGEPIPMLVDPRSLPPELIAYFAPRGLLERLRKKLARLTGKRGGKILPARNTIASVDDEDNLYVGVDFLEQFGDDENLVAGIMAHEWGHMISDLPKSADWSQFSWDELHSIRRDEEADADGFAGRALFLLGYRPESMIELLRKVDRRKKEKKLVTHKYHNTATRVEILRQSFKACERAFESARLLLASGALKGAAKIGRVLGEN